MATLGLWPVAEIGQTPGTAGGNILSCPVLSRSRELCLGQRAGSLARESAGP